MFYQKEGMFDINFTNYKLPKKTEGSDDVGFFQETILKTKLQQYIQGHRAAQTSGSSIQYFKSDAIYSTMKLNSNARFITCYNPLMSHF